MTSDQDQTMRNHWWWRPGWRQGRSFYTWHITFGDAPAAAQLRNAYAPALERLPGVDPVPLQWLHLTMQGLGFTDEVTDTDLHHIIQAAQRRCATLAPFTVTLGPLHADPEALPLSVAPAEPLIALRTHIRDAIAEVWSEVPEPADTFKPHVSLAYSNSDGPLHAVEKEIRQQGEHTAQVTITAASLIDLNRDNSAYEWTTIHEVPLTGA